MTAKNLKKLCFEIQYIKVDVTTPLASNVSTFHQNERAKNRKRIHYSDSIGTAQHENRKKQMKKYRAKTYSDIIGTRQHEIEKEQTRQYSAKRFSNSVGTPQQEYRRKKERISC